jgi:hypothetical protein
MARRASAAERIQPTPAELRMSRGQRIAPLRARQASVVGDSPSGAGPPSGALNSAAANCSTSDQQPRASYRARGSPPRR